VLFGSIMGVLAGVLVQQVLVHTLPAAYQLDPYHGKWVGLWALIGVLLVVVATSQ
jgi:zinc transporter ZupT